MKRILPFLVLALAGCASTEFKPYEGNAIVQGTGGTRETIDGIDVWENGTPPRKYKILGVIDDSRPGGIIQMANLKSDAAAKAKEFGADAVIIMASESEVTGHVNTGNAFGVYNPYTRTYSASGFGTSVPVRRNYAKFAAIKYLP